jgi:hypothetical protein
MARKSFYTDSLLNSSVTDPAACTDNTYALRWDVAERLALPLMNPRRHLKLLSHSPLSGSLECMLELLFVPSFFVPVNPSTFDGGQLCSLLELRHASCQPSSA